MNHSKLLATCLHELKRCAISLLFIIVGLFLATANAPAAERTESIYAAPSTTLKPPSNFV